MPDALSQMPADLDYILPRACVLGAMGWEVEEHFLQGQDLGVAPDRCPLNRLFVPADLKSAIIQCDHASPLSCHPRVVLDVWEILPACPTCARNKGSNKSASGLLHLLLTPR